MTFYCQLMCLKNFRNNSLKKLWVELESFLKVPALSLNAMLNMEKAELELILAGDFYLFSQKGMKDGVISKRYSETNNNKYLKSYDPKQELKHVIFLDVNNLYTFYVSVSSIRWI